MKIGRNDPCPCGSGKKYKKCCLDKDEEARRAQIAPNGLSVDSIRTPESNHESLDTEVQLAIPIDYYQQAFKLFHIELARNNLLTQKPHEIRSRFWKLVPEGRHGIQQARDFIFSYMSSLKSELSTIIGKNSIAYWLHAYRRLFPGPIGIEKDPMTILLTRSAFEAAVQKYATFEPCNKVGLLHEVGVEAVFNGLLLSENFEIERKHLESSKNQLVLTDFNHLDILDLYEVEKLAFEVWRCGAILRCIGKGAPFEVDYSWEGMFGDIRSEEFQFLVNNHDDRIGEGHSSATGTVYSDITNLSESGIGFIPIYNVSDLSNAALNSWFSLAFKMRFLPESSFNFIWLPHDLKRYYESHKPLAEAFRTRNGVSLEIVIGILAALCFSALYTWTKDRSRLMQFWLRGYKGPHTRDSIREEIAAYLEIGCKSLGFQVTPEITQEIDNGIYYWELGADKKKDIEIVYSGPHYIFLPFGSDLLFVDYGWIHRALFDLFYEVTIPDQNFKGDALESAIQDKLSVLPTSQCKARNNSKKQIDYAYACGEHLVIAECKAVGQRKIYELGDPQSIEYRRQQVVERGLKEADEKAQWLANNPIGTNYNINGFSDILPVAVSPFVEYIHSRDQKYWIDEKVPRVLSLWEFKRLIESQKIIDKSFNRVEIKAE